MWEKVTERKKVQNARKIGKNQRPEKERSARDVQTSLTSTQNVKAGRILIECKRKYIRGKKGRKGLEGGEWGKPSGKKFGRGKSY